MEKKYTSKRIGYKRYLYRGYMIQGYSYYPPDQCAVWEAIDEYNCGFAHSYSLRECKREIDKEIDDGTIIEKEDEK